MNSIRKLLLMGGVALSLLLGAAATSNAQSFSFSIQSGDPYYGPYYRPAPRYYYPPPRRYYYRPAPRYYRDRSEWREHRHHRHDHREHREHRRR